MTAMLVLALLLVAGTLVYTLMTRLAGSGDRRIRRLDWVLIGSCLCTLGLLGYSLALPTVRDTQDVTALIRQYGEAENPIGPVGATLIAGDGWYRVERTSDGGYVRVRIDPGNEETRRNLLLLAVVYWVGFGAFYRSRKTRQLG